MERTPPRSRLETLLPAWLASTGFHVTAGYVAMILWQVILIEFWLPGIPADDTYTFKWDNPFYRKASLDDESGDDGVVIYTPRRPRYIPEMEMPRSDYNWDSRKIPFDDALGQPSDFPRPTPGPTSLGFQKATGESLDFVSDKAFKGKGTYDTPGSGGGGGGRYGSKIVLKDTVQIGLLWLARHQNDDGSWSSSLLRNKCGQTLPDGQALAGPPCESEGKEENTLRLTALAALAFAGGGYRDQTAHIWDGVSYREVVKRACQYLSRTPPDPDSLSQVVLALRSFLRLPSPFGRQTPPSQLMIDVDRLRALIATSEADPFPPEGSDAAAWKALALIYSSQAGLTTSREHLARAKAELQRRCDTLPRFGPDSWPGEDLSGSYLRLLASFEESVSGPAVLLGSAAIYPRLRLGQSREIDACREGSWKPVAEESRLSTTILHLLALESLPGYGFRAGHLTRPSEEVRAREAMLQSIRQAHIDNVTAVPGVFRRGIERLRKKWLQSKQPLDEARVHQAFDPVELRYVRHVPTLTVGTHMESANDEEFQKFKPLGRLGGREDIITREVHEGLCKGDGIVGFDEEWTPIAPEPDDDLTTYGRTLIFTLPDGTNKPNGTPHWEQYVVIGFYSIR